MSASTNAIKFCWLSYFVRVFVIIDGNVAFLLFPLSVDVGTVAAKKRAVASVRAAACPARERSHTRLNAQHRAHSTSIPASLSFERAYARGRRRRRRVRARVALAFRRYQATLRRRTLRRARTRARLSHRTRWRRIVGGRSPGAIGHRGAHARGPRRRVRNKRQQTSRGAHEHGWDVQSARARETRARYKP